MPLIVDASVVIAWIMPDEHDPYAERVIEATLEIGFTVPSVFWDEVRNFLVTAISRKRLTPDQAGIALRLIRTWTIELGPDSIDDLILSLADKHNLSGYDATYLALAQNSNFPLATLDKKLRKAAREESLFWGV